MIKVNDGAPYTSAHEIPTSVSQGSQASSTNDGVSERCAGVHSGSDGSLVVAGVHVNENASLRGFPDEDVAVFECQASSCLPEYISSWYPALQRVDNINSSCACARRAQYSDVPLQGSVHQWSTPLVESRDVANSAVANCR